MNIRTFIFSGTVFISLVFGVWCGRVFESFERFSYLGNAIMVEIQIYKTLPDSVKNARAYLRASIIGKALEIKQLQGEPMKWWVFKSFHSETDVAELLSASKEGFEMKRME